MDNNLFKKINTDLQNAMKQKNELTLSVLRMMKSKIIKITSIIVIMSLLNLSGFCFAEASFFDAAASSSGPDNYSLQQPQYLFSEEELKTYLLGLRSSCRDTYCTRRLYCLPRLPIPITRSQL